MAAGTLSLNVAPFAALGPAFAIVSVYVIVDPASMFAGPALTSDTSATGVIAVLTVLELSARFGSDVPAGGDTEPVFDSGPLAGAVPEMVMTTLPPGGNTGTLPLTALPATPTDAGHTAPPLALPQLAVMPVIPAGTLSLNVAPFAALGPAFDIVSV